MLKRTILLAALLASVADLRADTSIRYPATAATSGWLVGNTTASAARAGTGTAGRCQSARTTAATLIPSAPRPGTVGAEPAVSWTRNDLRLAGTNPFRGAITLEFSVANPGPVHLAIYDLGGRAVRTLAEGETGGGWQRVRWNGDDDAGRHAPPGVYFARLRTPETSLTRRLILAR